MFVYIQGLDDEYQEEGKLLGHYTYQEDGESLQSFPVLVTVETFPNLLQLKKQFYICDDMLNIFPSSLSGAE